MYPSSKGTISVADKVIIVHLRQPRMNCPDEMRSDPFWELGSFGITGCHKKNVMHPSNAGQVSNARLAFAQGGPDGFKLVYLTPPVKIVMYTDRCEARWKYDRMPFRYDSAPLLINNNGDTDVPSLRQHIKSANLNTWMRKFSSRFRARRYPVDASIAREIAKTYDILAASGKLELFAREYEDALPTRPPKIDRDCQATYESLLTAANATHAIVASSNCGKCG
jgi:hypothetical protein